jgi:hypothetical protein
MGHTSHLNVIFYIFPAVALYTHVFSQLIAQLVFFMLLQGSILQLKHVGALKTSCGVSWK